MLRAKIAICGCALLLSVALTSPVCSDWTFIRGDGNGDGVVDVADPIWNLSYLFSAGPSLCLNAQDTNDDGAIDVADPIYGLSHLFSSGPPPPAPFPDCGDDPTPSGLNCQGPLGACSAPEPLFWAGATTYAVGDYPTSVALGDLDGDGDLDMVTANLGSDDASVLLGNADGSFAAAVSYAVGDEPTSVVLGDLDGDGDLDLVTANPSRDDASVLLGNGDGSFTAAVSYAVGARPLSVALGDLDGDGDLDMVTANYSSDDTSVLLGNGNGSFSAAVSYALGGGPLFVALGDLDGDGDLDMVTANVGNYPYYETTTSVLLGNGDGSFAAAVSYAVGGSGVALGDLDGDGDLDMVTANVGSYPDYNGTASVLLGNGDGSFAAVASYAVGDYPHSGALGDLDGDGDLDIVTANRGPYPDYDGTTSVLLGNGDGSFAAAVSYAVGDGYKPWSVALGDLDGDGDLDMVTANRHSEDATVLLNHTVP